MDNQAEALIEKLTQSVSERIKKTTDEVNENALFKPQNRKQRRALNKLIKSDKSDFEQYNGDIKEEIKKAVTIDLIMKLRKYQEEHNNGETTTNKE